MALILSKYPQMKKPHFFWVVLILTVITGRSFGQDNSNTAPAGDNKITAADSVAGDITTILIPHSKDAIFSALASYTFEVNNHFNIAQSGKISYRITDQFNHPIDSNSVEIKIAQQSSRSFDFTMPELKSGFYKLNFMINVSDYDDTTRRVFGIRPEEIRSSHPKPDDFEKFWEDTKAQLARIKPEYKITEKPELEKDKRKVFLIEMKSFGHKTVYAWLTEPEHHQKHQTFPVLIMLPGYQATNEPLLGRDDDMAFVGLDPRGQGLSKKDLDIRREDYIVDGLEDKDKYLMRGMIMDCLRAVDFVFSRPELSHDRVAVTGGSMGGYLAIATAALDKRVTICAPQNPFLSDIYNMDNGAVEWPVNFMKKYVTVIPNLTFNKVLENLRYYDTKNFADMITCPVVMGIGLLDPFVPPNNSYTVFNNIRSKKKLFVFKDLGHEVGDKYYRYETLYTRDYFGLF
ncbi:MAG TPA: acetylxylan esterase [Mucilaginibacter sp.]|nr:acetylxylan esterase [Mucilaginibacter sp.]